MGKVLMGLIAAGLVAFIIIVIVIPEKAFVSSGRQ